MSRIRAGRGVRPGRSERGFSLLVLLGIVTMMLIAVGAALPLWRAVVQRQKEAELVTRGFQYAEAIRVFQNRFGRLPNQLVELVEMEPRSIRRLWDDPMTGGPFLVLMEAPGGVLVAVDPESGEVVPAPGAVAPEDEEGEGPAAPQATPPPAPQFGGDGAPVAGPIHGVRSRGKGEAYRVLFDQKDYGSWEFTVERLVAATSARNDEGMLRRVDYATIGKPFRYPPPGGVAGANPQPIQGGPPGGRPRKPGDPPPGAQRPPLQELPDDEFDGGDDSGDGGGDGSEG